MISSKENQENFYIWACLPCLLVHVNVYKLNKDFLMKFGKIFTDFFLTRTVIHGMEMNLYKVHFLLYNCFIYVQICKILKLVCRIIHNNLISFADECKKGYVKLTDIFNPSNLY